MKTRASPLAFLLLGAVAVALPGARAQDAAEAPPASPNPHAGLNLESLSATRELPLFTPSRTAPVVEAFVEPEPAPEEPEPEPPPEAPPEPPPLRLIGVVLTAAEQVAILSNEGTGETHRLRPGEAFEDWTLEIVDTRTVAFANADQRHTFTMFEPGSETPPAPGARTPIPEEALQNPGAMFGGNQEYSEGEFSEDAEPDSMGQDSEPPPEAEVEESADPETPADVPEGEVEDGAERRTNEAEEPDEPDEPVDDSVFIPGQDEF